MRDDRLPGTGVGDFFQLLRDGRPRTRAELAEISSLSRPTIQARVDELLALGLVVPTSDAASTGGRPSARIAFNPDARLVLAVDVGATHVRAGVCNLAGAVLAQVQETIPVKDGPERVLDWVAHAATELLRSIDRRLTDIAAVGIGLPGPVDYATGRPSAPPIMPGWDGYDVAEHIKRFLPGPVLVDNDVNIMALGERATNWPQTDELMFVKVATGIGSGIISDGILRRGANGAAGDVGHVFVQRAAGRLCRCGKTGCVEAFAGAPGISQTLGRLGDESLGSEGILDLIRSGDLEAAHAVREAGRAIGEMLNVCISVVNPSVIVVGGTISQVGEGLLAGIREEVYANSAPLATKDLTIVTSRSGRDAAIIGAAIMAADYILDAEQVNAAANGGAPAAITA